MSLVESAASDSVDRRWPTGLIGHEQSEFVALGSPSSGGEQNQRSLDLYIGGYRAHRGGPAGRPQGFLVHVEKNGIVKPHYHRVDQFQVFFGEDGASYKNTAMPTGTVGVHYVDAYSTYGPFTGGPDGLDYFTLRANGDGFVGYMPEAREHHIHRKGKRSLFAQVDAASAPADGATTTNLFEHYDDGLACLLLRSSGDTEVVGPPLTGTSGQFYCVIRGDVATEQGVFGAKSLAWVPANGDPLRLRSTSSAEFQVLVLQFPALPSMPIPDPILVGASAPAPAVNSGG